MHFKPDHVKTKNTNKVVKMTAIKSTPYRVCLEVYRLA